MPTRAPSIRSCGCVVPANQKCHHALQRDRERKAAFDAKRPSARERGYDYKWDRERGEYLKLHPHCVKCGAPSRVVDHVIPHRGDRKLFWQRSNWQALCTPCHSGRKQSEEKRR